MPAFDGIHTQGTGCLQFEGHPPVRNERALRASTAGAKALSVSLL